MDKAAAQQKPDRFGNTALHYAVAMQCTPVIRDVLASPNLQGTIKNHCGESAADWLREYIYSTYNLEDPAELAELPKAIIQGDSAYVASFLALGISHKLRCLANDVIQTPLHLAIRHRQLEIVKLLLGDMDSALVAELLTVQDSWGQTPLVLAQKMQQYPAVQAEACHILGCLKSRVKESGGLATDSLSRAVTLPMVTLPENYRQSITTLNRHLTQGVKESDFPKLHATLPTLCTLAYFTCRQALSLLQRLPTSANLQSRDAEKLLKRLFATTHGHTTAMHDQLRQKIGTIAKYLACTIQQQQVSQVFELSTRCADPGGSSVSEHKIYLNLTIKTNQLDLVATVIHEASHMATMSYDFAYSHYVTSQGRYFTNFKPCARLAKTGIALQMPPNKEERLELQYQVERSDAVQWPETLGQWKALNNADSIATAAMGLAAIESSCATLNLRQQTFAISEDFLSCEHVAELQTRYSALNSHAIPRNPFITPKSLPGTPRPKAKVLGDDHSDASTAAGTPPSPAAFPGQWANRLVHASATVDFSLDNAGSSPQLPISHPLDSPMTQLSSSSLWSDCPN